MFTRNIKKPPSGSKAKKKSWPLLQNMMFLKTYVTAKGNELPGNLPSPPSESLEADDSSALSESQGVEEPHEEDDATGRGNEAINPSSQETATMGPPPKKKKKIQPTTADEMVVDYIRAKTSSDNPRKHFLLSLLPDVDEMTTTQFKSFRREVVNLIDRIVAPAWPTASDCQINYQQQPSISPISIHSWSGESSASASTSTSGQLPASEGVNVPQHDEVYTELEPFLTSKHL